MPQNINISSINGVYFMFLVMHNLSYFLAHPTGIADVLHWFVVPDDDQFNTLVHRKGPAANAFDSFSWLRIR